MVSFYSKERECVGGLIYFMKALFMAADSSRPFDSCVRTCCTTGVNTLALSWTLQPFFIKRGVAPCGVNQSHFLHDNYKAVRLMDIATATP